jgi:glycosyltransferase involved in cell wall biosynthesis
VWLLARELQRGDGVEQRVVTRHGSELARRLAADGVAVRGAPWSMGLDPRAWWRLAAETRAFRPAVVHAHNSHALSLALWARRFASPAPRLVVTRRVVYPVRRGSALFAADRVIAISTAVRETLVAAGVPPARIALVPSGVDPADVRRAATPILDPRTRLELAPGTPLAVTVAALEPAKDHATLLAAAAAARALRPDLHWVIAGAGPLAAALARRTRELGLEDRVHLIGWTDRPEALLAAADVVVLSSAEEGLGTVVLDALALGKPVVATRGGGLPDILPPESLAPVRDGAALAQRVVRALHHPSPLPLPLPPQFTAAAMSRGVLAAYRALV